MDVKAVVAKNGTILSWQVNGVDVIYPETLVSGEKRGGIPLCAPMFSVQQRPVDGCHLPIHGLLMYLSDEEKTELTPGDTWTTTHHFPASKEFAWDFSVTVTIKVRENKLDHTVTIKRNASCSNENKMPLSLGFHPYFSTFGKDFLHIIDDMETRKNEVPKDIINSHFATLHEGVAAVLRTAAGEVTITPTGFDEYCLWTDDINKYFCIEPIYQYREFGLKGTGLTAGAQKEVGCVLEFTPA